MRLLMISALAGYGHVRAAQALEVRARELYPDAEVRNVDILDYTAAIYRKAYAASYLKLADRAPELWGYLFNKGDRPRAQKRQAAIIRAFDRIEFASFRAMLREFAPDHVLCSHFLPAQILLPYEGKDWVNFTLNLCVTDYVAHGFWAQLNATRIFVASGEAVEELVEKGIERERVRQCGIPIMPQFGREYDRAALCAKFDLDPQIPTVLAMSGGWGAAGLPRLVETIMGFAPVQVIAIAGRNERMREKVADVPAPAGSRCLALGFVDNIYEYMAVSDLCVTKSGGLTTAECLAMGLPMLIPNPIPGQEERNAEYVTENGAALIARSPGALKYKIGKFLGDPELRRRMQAAAKARSAPHAAEQILRSVVEENAG
ncbi:MAG: glycosyltransferase [Planctomycetes bacterium]|nr:glycosyltransferase [Planctomycetota bacterium]MCB9935871.1 glycosyltransferase [Planctomycetota bacterium]